MLAGPDMFIHSQKNAIIAYEYEIRLKTPEWKGFAAYERDSVAKMECILKHCQKQSYSILEEICKPFDAFDKFDRHKRQENVSPMHLKQFAYNLDVATTCAQI